jgi:CRISPR-associated endonuclease/helicase Cas3
LHPEKKLIDLEQAAMAELRSLEKKGPDTVGGWQQTFWWLTAEPQQLNRFRASSGEDIELCYEYNEGKLRFCAKENDWNSIGETLGISLLEAPTEQVQQRYWLVRDYAAALRKYMETDEFVDERAAMKAASHRYGEIILTNYRDGGKYFYSDQLGLFRMETGEL